MTTEPVADETRRLRAVVARLAQMADHWEQKLPEVIRTPAVVSAIRAALEPAAVPVAAPPTTEQTAARPFPLPARAALITYAATTRTVTADALTPLLDAHEAEAHAILLRDLIAKAAEWDGHITVQELRRLAVEAGGPSRETTPEQPGEAASWHRTAGFDQHDDYRTAAPAVSSRPGTEQEA
jgi:hypothetical protein